MGAVDGHIWVVVVCMGWRVLHLGTCNDKREVFPFASLLCNASNVLPHCCGVHRSCYCEMIVNISLYLFAVFIDAWFTCITRSRLVERQEVPLRVTGSGTFFARLIWDCVFTLLVNPEEVFTTYSVEPVDDCVNNTMHIHYVFSGDQQNL